MGYVRVNLSTLNQSTYTNTKENTMITIDPNSKETHLAQIIDQWTEITELKAQWQRISNNTSHIEDYLRLEDTEENENICFIIDCINALITLSQCPTSTERLNIEQEILRELFSILQVNDHIYVINTIQDYRNQSYNHDGLWWTIKERLECIDVDDYESLSDYCDVLTILAQCSDSKEKRTIETEVGLDILDCIY